MGKKIGIGGLISPANLWGKPLPGAAATPKTTNEEKKVTGKMTDDDDIMEDADIDVDAELADADVDDEELHAVEAEVDAEVSDETDDSEPDDEESADEEPDYDAEDGDIKAEAESVVEEEVVTAVADDEEQEEVETKKVSTKRGKSSMADTKVSLSDHIRNEISKREASGGSLRGKDIVEALAKRKITVSPAQVSQLLKKAGLGGKARSRKPVAVGAEETAPSREARKGRRRDDAPATAPRAAAKAPRPDSNSGFKVPMAQLQAAESFVQACGGSFKNAERILTAASQLSQTFGG